MLVASSALALGWSAPVDAGTPVSGPVAHDNLAVYFVHGSAAEGTVPMSLEEALAKGQVKVSETGSINELTVENVGDDEVFVQAGDIVKGGRQDRVLSVDLLLPPHSGQVPIAAFCVEPGMAAVEAENCLGSSWPRADQRPRPRCGSQLQSGVRAEFARQISPGAAQPKRNEAVQA
jgi:hypothetical protein